MMKRLIWSLAIAGGVGLSGPAFADDAEAVVGDAKAAPATQPAEADAGAAITEEMESLKDALDGVGKELNKSVTEKIEAELKPKTTDSEKPAKNAAEETKTQVIGQGFSDAPPAGSAGTIGTSLQTKMVDKTNLFDDAISYAQKRSVKIFGGGIGREHGYATGLIVSGDGEIICAHGIYASAPRLRVVMYDGQVHYATVMRRSDDLQVIMLKKNAKTPDFFDLTKAGSADKGDWVVGVSNSFAVAQFEEKLSANLGIVSMRSELDVKRRAAEMTYNAEAIVIDAITSNPGSPGGALMTVDGKLVGMLGKNLQSKSTNTWINYAVPTELLHDFMTGKKVNAERPKDVKPYIGMKVFGINRRAPAYVDRVRMDSPADDAGLRKDDMILAIGDETILDVQAYKKHFKTLVPGEKVKFIVKRGTEVKTLWVTPIAEEDDD